MTQFSLNHLRNSNVLEMSHIMEIKVCKLVLPLQRRNASLSSHGEKCSHAFHAMKRIVFCSWVPSAPKPFKINTIKNFN